MELKYLVTGTGRSGTVFLARFLTSIGILCGHETIFDYRGMHGARRRLAGEEKLKLSIASSVKYVPFKDHSLSVNWHPDTQNIIADSSYMAAPFLDQFPDAYIIHAVRHPVRVINSFCNHIRYFIWTNSENVYEKFIYSIVPELKEPMPQYDRAALYYLKWNEMIEKNKIDLFVRVEDDPEDLLKFFGLPKDTPHFSDTTANTYRRTNVERFTIDQIENAQIKEDLIKMGERYGYNMQLDYLLI